MERNGSTTGGDDSKFEEMMQEAGLGDGFTPPPRYMCRNLAKTVRF